MKKVFIIIVLFCAYGFSEISVSDIVKSFVDNPKTFRSRLLKYEVIPDHVDLPIEFVDDEDESLWKTKKKVNYIIDYSKMSKCADKFRDLFAYEGLTEYQYMDQSNLLVFNHPNGGREVSAQIVRDLINTRTEAELKNIGLTLGEKLFAIFKNKIEFQCTEIEYTRGHTNLNQISKYSIRYRRIFNDGIVLQNISYIMLTLDGLGDLIEVEIKWPKFKKCENIKNGILIKDALILAKQEYNEIASRKVDEFLNIEAIDRLSITGSCFGWTHEIIDGVNLLKPSYGFVGIAETKNGKKEHHYINIDK